LVDICGYELPTNLQNFTQKDLIEMKIFSKVLGDTFLKHPVVKGRCLASYSMYWTTSHL